MTMRCTWFAAATGVTAYGGPTPAPAPPLRPVQTTANAGLVGHRGQAPPSVGVSPLSTPRRLVIEGVGASNDRHNLLEHT